MKFRDMILIFSLLMIGIILIIFSIVNSKHNSFFPSKVVNGILVCHDPIVNRTVFIPFEKFPRINNNWIEIVNKKENKVVLTNLHCVITYEPKEKER